MPPTSSTLPSGNSGEVKVLRATAAPRTRTFASPFRQGRVAATFESEHSPEPDIMDELDALLGASDDDFDLDGDEPQAAPKAAPKKKAAPKRASKPVVTVTRAESPERSVSVPDDEAVASQPRPAAAAEDGARPAASAQATIARSTAVPAAPALAPAAEAVKETGPAPEASVQSRPAPRVEQDTAPAVAPAKPAEEAPDAVKAIAAADLGGLEFSEAPVGGVVLSEAERELHRRGADAVSWLAGRVGPAAEKALAEARRDLMRLSRSVRVSEGTMADVKMHQLASAVLLRHGFSLDKRQPGIRTAFSASLGPGTGPVALFAVEAGAPGDAEDHAGIAALVGGAIALSAVAPGLGLTVRFVGIPRGSGSLAALLKDGYLDGTTLVASAGRSAADEVPLGGASGRSWEARFAVPSKLEATALPVNTQDALAMAKSALGLLAAQLPTGTSLGASLEDSTLSVRLEAGSTAAGTATAERIEAALRGSAQATGCVVKLRETSGPGSEVQQDAVLAGAYRNAVSLRGRDVEFASTQPEAPLAALSEAFPTLHVNVGPGDGLPGGTDAGMVDASYGLALAAAAGCLAGTAR